MLFNSYIFVFIFLPITICGYFFLNHINKTKISLIFLAGMSLWFYGYFNYKYLFIIVGSILFNHSYATLIQRFRGKAFVRTITFLIILFFNIGLIFYYKYYDFFVTNTNKLFHTDFTLQNIVLPLGISFFTIQQISYVIDVYRGKAERVSFIEYTVYVTFFPQLIAGPIVRYDELIPQLKDSRLKVFNWDNFTRGVYCFVIGMSKKVLIADMFGRVANYGFTNYTTLNSASLLFACFSYTIQIYFDFSGYSDMAIGLGKMLNFTLPINFHSPYKAVTISDFWNRWHLTLTRFLREYIYFPLGGNKKGTVRTYLNIFLVFLVSGIWHGANWTFILWGGVHGIAMIVQRVFEKYLSRIPKIILWTSNFLFLTASWTLFRADSVSQAFDMYRRILACSGREINDYMIQNAIPLEIRTVTYVLSQLWPSITYTAKYISLFICLSVMLLILKGKNAQELTKIFKPNTKNCILIAVLTWLCIISFSGVSTFLYFNF